MPSKTPTNHSSNKPVANSAATSREPAIKKRISPRTLTKVIIAAVVIAALIGYFAWDIIARCPLTTLLTNRDQLVATVNSWGPFAPLLYILLQILQTVVAPIPGQIVGSIGGFLFGVWGILWTTIGTLIGCWIVFKIARRFGRPLLEKLFKKSAIDKFDFIINAKSASLILLAIFLLPGFPDDVVCYIAGLTNLSIKRLITIVLLGRFPIIVLTNYIGAEIGTNFGLVFLLSFATVIILGIGIWQRERITTFLKQTANSKQDAEHEQTTDKPTTLQS